jgi:hypothetical protein
LSGSTSAGDCFFSLSEIPASWALGGRPVAVFFLAGVGVAAQIFAQVALAGTILGVCRVVVLALAQGFHAFFVFFLLFLVIAFPGFAYLLAQAFPFLAGKRAPVRFRLRGRKNGKSGEERQEAAER